MTTLPVPIAATDWNAGVVPALGAAGQRAGMRFLEFFAANIRNPHTRRTYVRAADEFLAWCASVGVPVDRRCPTGARRNMDRGRNARAGGAERQTTLAVLRHLFDWLVTGQVVPANPAGSVRGPRDAGSPLWVKRQGLTSPQWVKLRPTTDAGADSYGAPIAVIRCRRDGCDT